MDDLGSTFGLSPGIFGAFLGMALLGGLVLLIALTMEDVHPAMVMILGLGVVSFNVMLNLWDIWTAMLIFMGMALVITVWGKS